MFLAHLAILFVCFYFIAIIVHEYFLHSIDYIAKKLGLSSEVAGATLMAVGSSAPELSISVIAVLIVGQHESIGISIIIGSALFNLLVIVGISSLFSHAKLTWQVTIRDLLFYILSIGLLMAAFYDKRISLVEAGFFLFAYAIYVFFVVRWKGLIGYRFHDKLDPKITSEKIRGFAFFDVGIKLLNTILPSREQKKHMIWLFLLAIIAIGSLSYIMVEAAVQVSAELNIPESIIALTILAMGTSIPDFLSSVFVSSRGRGDMAISNAIGANVFNTLIGLGLPWFAVLLFRGGLKGAWIDLHVQNGTLLQGMVLLLATSVVVLGVMIFNKWKMGKNVGAFLIFSYVMFVLYVLARDVLL